MGESNERFHSICHHYKACRVFLPGPSDEDRAGELSFGRFALGGPISMMLSAIPSMIFAVLRLVFVIRERGE